VLDELQMIILDRAAEVPLLQHEQHVLGIDLERAALLVG